MKIFERADEFGDTVTVRPCLTDLAKPGSVVVTNTESGMVASLPVLLTREDVEALVAALRAHLDRTEES